jgi:hypothetical protein
MRRRSRDKERRARFPLVPLQGKGAQRADTMAARLNQIIAVEKGIKNQSFQEITEAHQALQKPVLLSGIARTYRPKDEEGEQLPPESTRVQLKAEAVIGQTTESLTRLFDM